MSATKDDINAAVTMTQSSRQIKFQERMKVKKQAKMQSNFRKFVKQRIERRKAGGGNEANSDRGLASLNFVNHSMPQNQHQKLLQNLSQTGVLVQISLFSFNFIFEFEVCQNEYTVCDVV